MRARPAPARPRSSRPCATPGVAPRGRLRGPARRRRPRRARRALQGHGAGGAGAVRHVARLRAREPADDVPARPRRRRSRATAVGWDADALAALVGQACAAVGAPAPGDHRRAAAHEARLRGQVDLRRGDAGAASSSAGAADEMEDMFERGWTDGLPVVPPTPRARRRDARRPRPAAVARRGAARHGRGDARARRRLRGPRRLPPGVLPGRAGGGGGGARPGLQPQRAGGDDPAGGPARHRQRPGPRGDRPAQRHGRARPRLAREPDDRPRAAAASSR